ncbi:MAG: hypothetical protein LBV32_00350 [Tannerellaceae bacterium]|jgi:hypothetical protein|nr:hypothetical protein [Tannerellaceae bacterium]
MKLNHLLFGSMIALAFTACSEKDPAIPEPDPAIRTALSLKLDKKGPVTRAEGGNIASLHVIVADEGGNIEAIEAADTQGLIDSEVIDIELSAGTKSVVVFANLPDDLIGGFETGDLLTDLLEDAANLSFTVAEGNPTAGDELLFTMNSKVHTGIEIYEGIHHYLGYASGTGDNMLFYDANDDGEFDPVRLYRNVAKVIISDITLGDVVYADRAKTQRLFQPTFTIDEIAVVQSMAESKMAGTEFGEWASTFVPDTYISGYAADAYGAFAAGANFKTIVEYDGALEDSYINVYETPLAVEDYEDNSVEFFVYENTLASQDEHILTLVTVKGTISGYLKWEDTNTNQAVDEGELSEPLTTTDRYYTVAVGVTGFNTQPNIGYSIEGDVYQDKGRNLIVDTPVFLGVLRNLQYNISMNLTGRGSPSPFGPPEGGETGDLDVFAEVVPWGTVTQSVPVE